ncbi:MAG: hypothetical protein WDM92_06295 [Caulobacteraceae bacterium]
MSEKITPLNGAAEKPRARRAPRERSHAEIYDRVGAVERDVVAIKSLASAAATDAKAAADRTIAQGMHNQRVDTTLEDIKAILAEVREAIGWERRDERGQWIGVGLRGEIGRVGRLVSHELRHVDGWRKYLAGALAVLVPAALVIWWLVSKRVDVVLR